MDQVWNLQMIRSGIKLWIQCLTDTNQGIYAVCSNPEDTSFGERLKLTSFDSEENCNDEDEDGKGDLPEEEGLESNDNVEASEEGNQTLDDKEADKKKLKKLVAKPHEKR